MFCRDFRKRRPTSILGSDRLLNLRAFSFLGDGGGFRALFAKTFDLLFPTPQVRKKWLHT